MGLLELLGVLGPKRFQELFGEGVPQRQTLSNLDPTRTLNSVIPNVYRGTLQPDMESGQSLPLNYNPNKKMRI